MVVRWGPESMSFGWLHEKRPAETREVSVPSACGHRPSLPLCPPHAQFSFESITVHLTLKRDLPNCAVLKEARGPLWQCVVAGTLLRSHLRVGSWCGARASAFLELASPSVRWDCCCLPHPLPGLRQFCFLVLSHSRRIGRDFLRRN